MNLLGAEVLLRQVPATLRAGLDAGHYRVYGSILRSTSNGRIVGHLQETSALTSILAKGPLGGLELVGQAVSMVQNEQIKSAIETVKTLQVAGLALGAVSIGVSIAGTAILARRIDQVEQKVDGLMPHLEALARGIETLRRDRIEEDVTRLKTLADQIDECWLLDLAQAEWRALARDAHFLAGSFARRAGELNEQGGEDRLASEPFTEAFALAASLRITARLAAGDDEAARVAAVEQANTLDSLSQPLRLSRMVLEAARHFADCAGTPIWNQRLEETVAHLRPSLDHSRQRQIVAAGTALTLQALAEEGISGRDWLATARGEHTSPVLFLSAGGS